MGLEQFMGDLGVETEESETKADKEPGAPGPDYTYDGDKDLLTVDEDDVVEVLEDTEFNFKKITQPIGGINYTAYSPKQEYAIVISYPRDTTHRDCILVSVIDTDTKYDVIEPYPVYMVQSWKEELKNAISTIPEKKNELLFCHKCGGIMIIRKTNTTKERIRGCTNYPDCRHSEILNNGT